MKYFKHIFYTYPAWLIVAQVAAFFYGTAQSNFSMRAFISVNGVEFLFALYMLYYLFNLEDSWISWVKKVLAGFGYAFLVIIFFHVLFSFV